MTLSPMMRVPGRESLSRPFEIVGVVGLVGVEEDKVEGCRLVWAWRRARDSSALPTLRSTSEDRPARLMFSPQLLWRVLD